MQTLPKPTVEALADDLNCLVGYIHKAGAPDLFQLAAELDLSISHMRALGLLERAGGELGLGELADTVGLSMATASRAVDALHRAGLVSRREDPHDRRAKRVQLTEAGSEVLARLARARIAALRDIAATLSDDERLALRSALAPLLARPEVGACRAAEERR